MRWTKEKPKITKDCIVLTAIWWDSQRQWDYDAYLIVYDGYWRWCDMAGNEIGDIADLHADFYMAITLPVVSKSVACCGGCGQIIKNLIK